ncbi:MAG: sterol carrier protein domain-containing protein [Armatimonadetes bacterium]|nr:sterol carrier protein domain-containing protein [Armatimonadota bacterium]
MVLRPYNAETDRESTRRIWQEIGWLKDDDDFDSFDRGVAANRSLVGELDGQAECLVQSAPGTLRYLDRDLPLCSVCAVTTSHLARQGGMATQLVARLVAEDALAGAAVQCLGMFDQGFYDRLGFGAGGFDIWAQFDPATLTVGRAFRAPKRLTKEHGEQAHAARVARRRGHGAVTVTAAEPTTCGAFAQKDHAGYGWFDGNTLTHFFWGRFKERYHGPLHIHMMAWSEPEQLLEMLAFLRSLGDQIHAVGMVEPAEIQIQDLLRTPARAERVREKGEFETGYDANVWWQMRMNDVPTCVAACRGVGERLRFNARLTDPVVDHLPPDMPWRGAGGDYVVTVGDESGAEVGFDASLPTLEATINAFTRLWLGVRPASGLAVTDRLSGPRELLERLDGALRLPTPRPNWDL